MRNVAFYHPVRCCLRVFQNIPYKSRVAKQQHGNRDVTGGGGDFKNKSKGTQNAE